MNKFDCIVFGVFGCNQHIRLRSQILTTVLVWNAKMVEHVRTTARFSPAGARVHIPEIFVNTRLVKLLCLVACLTSL